MKKEQIQSHYQQPKTKQKNLISKKAQIQNKNKKGRVT